MSTNLFETWREIAVQFTPPMPGVRLVRRHVSAVPDYTLCMDGGGEKFFTLVTWPWHKNPRRLYVTPQHPDGYCLFTDVLPFDMVFVVEMTAENLEAARQAYFGWMIDHLTLWIEHDRTSREMTP